MNEFDELRKIFIDDVDEEDRAENAARIQEWETELHANEAIAGWRENDVTRQLAAQARHSYKEFAVKLANDRDLTQAQRESLWAKQDACLLILSLTEIDAQGRIQQIRQEIAAAIEKATAATN